MSSFDKSVTGLTLSLQQMSISKETVAGCNIPAIVSIMYNEQSEHLFCKFSEAFIKYRQVVVEWMIDVAEYFHLHSTTTHAAIAYLDRLQPNERFSRFEWQMLAICCLIISSKYNECEEHVPSLAQLEEITQQRITNDCVLNYELWALKRMGWKLNARTPMAFLTCFITQGVVSSTHYCESLEAWNETHASRKKYLEQKMLKMATKCVIDVRYKHLQASAVAAAIVYLTRQQCKAQPLWSEELSYICLHDPLSSKNVQKMINLYEDILFEETAPEESVHEISSVSSPLRASSSIDNYGEDENSNPMLTPQPKTNVDKENAKPHSEISPIAIADMASLS